MADMGGSNCRREKNLGRVFVRGKWSTATGWVGVGGVDVAQLGPKGRVYEVCFLILEVNDEPEEKSLGHNAATKTKLSG